MLSRKTIFKLMSAAAITLMTLSSCSTPKDITYFQDVSNGNRIELAPAKEMVVKPYDRLTILVHSKDPQLATLFNLSISSQRVGQGTQNANNNGNNQNAAYVVNAYGDIEFPVLGTLHIGGMTRTEVAEYVKKELIARNLVKDPTVIVDIYGRTVNVLGDVGSPGKVNMDKDRFTIIDAIASAGDLTIQGKRANVMVLRQEDGREVVHTVDLTDAKSLMSSPVYYLQQDDVIYVEPTDTKKRTTTPNGNAVFTPSFWISLVSFATTLLLLIKNW